MGTADSEIGRKSPATYPAPSAQAGWRGNGVCGPGRDAIAWTGMGASSFIEAGYCIACAFGTIGLLFYAEGSLASAIHEFGGIWMTARTRWLFASGWIAALLAVRRM